MERQPGKMREKTVRETLGLSSGHPESTKASPLLPIDFASWKLAAPAAGLLGLGVYAGFRKQVDIRFWQYGVPRAALPHLAKMLQ